MDTYFNVDSWKCIKCYKCIRLCMADDCDYGLGSLNIGFMGSPEYWHDVCSCHHCNIPINEDGEYDKENGKMTHSPCAKICPSDAIEIERW